MACLGKRGNSDPLYYSAIRERYLITDEYIISSFKEYLDYLYEPLIARAQVEKDCVSFINAYYLTEAQLNRSE